MIFPEFNHAEKHYDRYGRFYMNVPDMQMAYGYRPLILFETGEMALESCGWKPHWRNTYHAVGIGIFYHNDKQMPRVYLNGEKLPIAHLSIGGAQKLVVDYRHGVAVNAQAYHGGVRFTQEVPKYFRSECPIPLSALWPSADATPIGAQEVYITRPMKAPKDEQQEVDGIIAACKMWANLQREKDENIKRMFQYTWAQPSSQALRQEILGRPLTDLPPHIKLQVAFRGVAPSRATTRVPHVSLSKSA